MRVLQVLRCDPVHRAWFSSRHPESTGWPAARQVTSLIADGAGALQAWAADLDPAEAFLCYGNDGLSQGAWVAEKGERTLIGAGAILAAQITAFRPDLVLLDAALPDLAADARRALGPRGKLVGFALHRSLVAEPELFDAVIHPDRLTCRALAPAHATPTVDVLCRAQVGRDARAMAAFLVAVSKAPLGLMGEFTIAYHLTAEAPADLPVGLAVHDRGALYGSAFRATTGSARLVIDLDDGVSNTTRIDRLMELAACGATILAQDGPVARCLDDTVAFFTTPDQLVELIYALLKDGARRTALGAAAQKMTATPPDAAQIRGVLAEEAA